MFLNWKRSQQPLCTVLSKDTSQGWGGLILDQVDRHDHVNHLYTLLHHVHIHILSTFHPHNSSKFMNVLCRNWRLIISPHISNTLPYLKQHVTELCGGGAHMSFTDPLDIHVSMKCVSTQPLVEVQWYSTLNAMMCSNMEWFLHETVTNLVINPYTSSSTMQIFSTYNECIFQVPVHKLLHAHIQTTYMYMYSTHPEIHQHTGSPHTAPYLNSFPPSALLSHTHRLHTCTVYSIKSIYTIYKPLYWKSTHCPLLEISLAN